MSVKPYSLSFSKQYLYVFIGRSQLNIEGRSIRSFGKKMLDGQLEIHCGGFINQLNFIIWTL